MRVYRHFLPILVILVAAELGRGDDDEDEDVYTTKDPKKREPSPCEVCKYFVSELRERLANSSRSKEVIETGHGLDTKKKRFPYKYSELRLTEALNDPHICENILNYNVHAEREGSLRYAKGQSETMSTLHGLVHKGVKVELGIPYDLWDKPSAEVSKMHRACFKLAEDYEELVEDWYFNNQDADLMELVCKRNYLLGKDQKCLNEIYFPKGDTGDKEDDSPKPKKKKSKKQKKNKKGDTEGHDVVPPAVDEDAAAADETKKEQKDEL